MRVAQLSSLQVLRGIAAFSVVCHHALRAVTVNLPREFPDVPPLAIFHPALIDLMSFGVDLFFVLSGFLMIYISEPYRTRRRSVGHFLLQRAIRIWPLYALATFAALAPTLAAYLQGGPLVYDLTPLRLAGFFFVPSFDMNGLVQPILGVGWTLQYEALFYLCFALALLLLRERLLPGLIGVLAVAYVVGWALPGATAAHVFLSDGIVFEFLYGAVVARLVLGHHAADPRRGCVALVLGAVLLAACAQIPGDSPYRALARGIPAALLLYGMISVDGAVAWPGFLLRLGNASYSLYLVQVLVVYRVVRRVLLPHAAGGLGGNPAEAALGAILVTVAAGFAVHFALEQPLLKLCHGLVDRFKPAPSPSVEDPAPSSAQGTA